MVFLTVAITRLGRRIALLIDENTGAGTHIVSFNPTGFSSGVYLYRLSTRRGQVSKVLTLLNS